MIETLQRQTLMGEYDQNIEILGQIYPLMFVVVEIFIKFLVFFVSVKIATSML